MASSVFLEDGATADSQLVPHSSLLLDTLCQASRPPKPSDSEGAGAALDEASASSLLLDTLRRLAVDGAPAALPRVLELFALAHPRWLGAHVLLVAWAAVWCERPGAVEGLLYAHAVNLKGACSARWAVRSTGPSPGVAEPLAIAARRARLLDGLERAYMQQRPGSAAAAKPEHESRRAVVLQTHDRFWGALAAAPTRLRALTPSASSAERDALARALVGAAVAAASLPAQLVLLIFISYLEFLMQWGTLADDLVAISHYLRLLHSYWLLFMYGDFGCTCPLPASDLNRLSSSLDSH